MQPSITIYRRDGKIMKYERK